MLEGLRSSARARLLLTLALTVTLVVIAWPRALGGATSYVVVSGISMRPLLESGDLAVVRRASTYDVDDVIAFSTVDGDVIHRIVGGDGVTGYVTQGDNVADVDPYRPTDAEVRGRLWWHVPRLGAVGLRVVRTIPPWALIAGALVVGVTTPSRTTRRRRVRGRRAGSRSAPPTVEGTVPSDLFSRRRLQIAAVCGFVALVVLPSVVVAWSTPTELPAAAGRAQVLSLQVTGVGSPGDAFPAGRSTPVPADPADAAADGVIPLSGLRTLEVVASYERDGTAAPGAATAMATVGVEVVATSTDGAEVEIPVEVASTGVGTRTATVELDVAAADEALAAIPTAEGGLAALQLRPTALVVEPEVTSLAGEPLVLRVDGDQLVVEGVARTEITPDGDEAASATVGLLGVTLPTSVVRLLGTALLLALLGAAGWLVWQEQDEDPQLRIRLLHGRLLVALAPEAEVGGAQVPVADIDELARLARRDQRSILHRPTDNGRRYLVPDGELTYVFELEVPSADDDATPGVAGTVADPDHLDGGTATAGPSARDPFARPGDGPAAASDRIGPDDPDQGGFAHDPDRLAELVRDDDLEVGSFDELSALASEPTADGGEASLDRAAAGEGRWFYVLVREGQRFTYLAGPDEVVHRVRSRSGRG